MQTRDQVYAAVDSERDYQDRKWGKLMQHPHEVGGWILLMENTLGKARAAWAGNSNDYVALEEVRQVVSLGVACGEQHGFTLRSPHDAHFKNMRENDY